MKLDSVIKQFKTSKQLYSNTVWLLGSEVAAKLSRLVTLLAMAASITQAEYGTAMLAIAIHEIVRLIQRSGSGAQIIQCSDEDLPSLCQNATVLQWLICSVLCAIQVIAGIAAAFIYERPELGWLIGLMSLGYLFYPAVAVRAYLLQRANQMRYFSLTSCASVTADNLITAVAFVFDAGIYALVAGKVAYGITWSLGLLNAKVTGYGIKYNQDVFVRLVTTSTQLVGSEFAKSLRLHADTFIAGKILAPEAFGLYSFAKSAGIGLSQSLSFAFVTALYPHLCKIRRLNPLAGLNKKAYGLAAFVSLAFVAQSLLSPFYVTWFFPESWHSTGFMMALLCLCAPPLLMLDTFCCLLRVKGNFIHEARIRLASLCITAATLLVAAPATSMEFIYLLLGIAYSLPLIAWLASYLGFGSNSVNTKFAKE